MSNQSDIARLRKAIDARNEAGERAISDFAATASHASIVTRATQLSRLVEEGRCDEAFEVWNDAKLSQELQETASFAIDPGFIEQLRGGLLQEYRNFYAHSFDRQGFTKN